MIKILLIEDDIEDALLFEETFSVSSNVEHLIVHKTTLNEGIKSLGDNEFDVVMLDMGLPDSQGIETLDRFTENSSKLPVIVLTGHEDFHTSLMALEGGAQDYLVKGEFNSDLLYRTIRYAIERKKYKDKIAENESLLKNIIESNVDGMLILDNEGRIVFSNNAADKMFGKTKNKLIGYPFSFQPDEEVQEIDIVNKKGEIIVGEMYCTPINWKDTNSTLASIRDITDRKQREEELIEHQSRLMELTDQLRTSEEGAKNIYKYLPVPTYTIEKINDKYILTDFNNEAEKIFEGDLSDLLGKELGHLENKIPFIFKDICRCYKEKYTLIEEFERLTESDEKKDYFKLTYAYVPPEKIILHTENITKKKEIDKIKSEIISNVSHELRTPLSILKEGVSLLYDEIPGKINSKQHKILNMAKGNIDRLAAIINNLLDISKMESGKNDLQMTLVNLPVFINEVVSNFNQKTREKGLQLKVNKIPEDLKIYFDEDKIYQVLINLLQNSMKFTEKGNIEVSVKNRPNEVEFCVKDSGIGISKENLPKLFDRFQQFSPGYGTQAGTGLGLSISKSILKLHGGKIWAESEFGKGSRFFFCIPKYNRNKILIEFIQKQIDNAELESIGFTISAVRVLNLEELKVEIGVKNVLLELEKMRFAIDGILRRRGDRTKSFSEDIIVIFEACSRENAVNVKNRLQQTLENHLLTSSLDNRIKTECDSVTFPNDAKDAKGLLKKLNLLKS